MRWLAVCALAVLIAGCGQSPPQDTFSATTASIGPVNPARIDRARDQVPDGYEAAVYAGPPAPIALWGMGDSATAEPPECLRLAVPPVDLATAGGWSASGPGGIIYAVVAATTEPAHAGADCPHWQVASARSTATVTDIPAPVIPSAQTEGMSTEARTVVEGGAETHTHAATFVADLGDYLCMVAVVTDPGATAPALTTEFAAGLLTETVAALRG
ncbi:DUF5642 family protein [Mycolicibacterium vaccae]|uniref:DUF5642 family protein n=1 Tax=Mycolicibacterium vaccae TaxID=1810 RepID=UPI003CECF663